MSPTHVEIESIVRLAIAAGFGMIIGIEREWREQAAGLRTHMLVCVGACLFTIVSAFGFHGLSGGRAADPSRVASNIVTGVGFLGAGAILREGISVRGLTTAASLWVVAAIGTGVGAGLYWESGAAAVITLIGLWALRPFRRRIREATDREA
jgi:putative Mg2+ transporter-C (MgtC) family protein